MSCCLQWCSRSECEPANRFVFLFVQKTVHIARLTHSWSRQGLFVCVCQMRTLPSFTLWNVVHYALLDFPRGAAKHPDKWQQLGGTLASWNWGNEVERPNAVKHSLLAMPRRIGTHPVGKSNCHRTRL